MKKRNRSVLSVVMLAAVATAVTAPEASADAWARQLSCPLGGTATISSNSSVNKRVEHYYDGVLRGSKNTGGSFTTSKPNVSGYVMASITAYDKLFPQSANCYCPPGANCGG